VNANQAAKVSDAISQGLMLYLSREDVEQVALSIQTVVELLETAFREKAHGRVEMPPKPGIHTRPDAFIHAMPAYIPALRSAGIKWIGAYPGNPERRLPYITGLLILNDDETGMPYAVMDGTWVTAYRTGAATALAARHLARADSATVGIIGCGVQGRSNLAALAATFPLQQVYAYDVAIDARDCYVAEMSSRLGLAVQGVDRPEDAVVASDLVITAAPIAKQPTPTIQPGWFKAGAFASAVDFDSYWTPAALAEVDKLATDDHAQFRYYQSLGYFRGTPSPYASLDEIVLGCKPGRERDDERTLAMNLGLAIDDMAVAPEIVRRACEQGIGTWLQR
jgi:ornithine cyclodeaminase/alanine dehydrogenase